MSKKRFLYFFVGLVIFVVIFLLYQKNRQYLPVVAIANYGPHVSLNNAITGFKDEMRREGFIEGKTIHYEIADVSFNPALIPQMLSSLKAKNPKLMVVMTTPVAQMAKSKIHDIPLIYSVITDPVGAGLISHPHQAAMNMTGSSDKQDLSVFFKFVQSVLPRAKKIGLLYALSESNDIALVNMMRDSAERFGLSVIAIPIEETRDVPVRIKLFKDKVDLIYVGASGPIQPALPIIMTEARQMRIPVFNVEAQSVKEGLAVGSFGVDYNAVGKNTAQLASAVLRGTPVRELRPVYPDVTNYHGVINESLANTLGIKIPSNVEVVR